MRLLGPDILVGCVSMLMLIRAVRRKRKPSLTTGLYPTLLMRSVLANAPPMSQVTRHLLLLNSKNHNLCVFWVGISPPPNRFNGLEVKSIDCPLVI